MLTILKTASKRRTRYLLLREITRRLGTPATRLPHKRRGERPRDYRADYNDWTAARVAEQFAVDVRSFGYRFDAPREWPTDNDRLDPNPAPPRIAKWSNSTL